MSYIDPAGKLLKHLDRIVPVLQGNKLTPPINVEIDLSNRCSLGCEGCHFAYTHSRGYFATGRTVDTGDLMDTTLIKLILDQLRAAGVRSVTWTGGGEPTLHPDFDEIVEYCQLPQGIYTNGTNIDPARADLLKRKMEWVYISLDYADRLTYKKHKKADLLTKIMGSVKRLVEAEGKATIGLGFLLWQKNWINFRSAIAVGDYLGVDYVQFRPMVLPGEMDKAWMNEMITELEYHQGMPKILVDVDRFRAYQNWKGHGYDTCYWSRLQTVITPNGKVWTCVNRRGFTGDELGDLNTELFINIWPRYAAKMVDGDCRVFCRGHIPNLALDSLTERPQGHELFV